jgi:membrane fusion protein (multidrug efflux system)
LGPILALLGIAYFYFTGSRYISTEDAYVRAETVNLSTDMSGIVAQILVHDNQRVTAGQPLFRLDDEPFRIALANAEAQLGGARNDIVALRATYRQKLADIKLAEQHLTFSEREYQRQKALASQSFASQQALRSGAPLSRYRQGQSCQPAATTRRHRRAIERQPRAADRSPAAVSRSARASRYGKA